MTDEALMARALELAERGRFTVSPNPMVGCVVARDGRILGEGFHAQAGLPHAETEALRACTESPEGADVFLTLEPCTHFGRTPPCVDALIEAAVRRVVIATSDPHPKVNGRGITRLREAGIEVEIGTRREEVERLNEKFLWSARESRPFLLVKAGMSLDGKLATVGRRSRWITSTEARQKSLALREEYDAILVGSGTVREDDPSLTRRLGWSAGKTKWTRIVVDGTGDLSADATLLLDGQPTLVFTSKPDLLRAAGPAVEVVPAEAIGGRVDLPRVLGECWSRGIHSIVAEGGSLLHSEIIRLALWQKMIVFVAPMILGGADAPALYSGEGAVELTDAWRFRFDRAERVGADLMIVAYPR